MVHVDPVSDLVRHHPTKNVRRSEDEPPIIADGAAGRAAAPAADRIANRDRPNCHPRGIRRRRGFPAEPRTGFGAEKSLDPRGECRSRTAALQPGFDNGRRSREPFVPMQLQRSAFERDRRSGQEGLGGFDAADLPLHPFGLTLRPFQRHPACHPTGAGQGEEAARLVEPEAKRPRAWMDSKFDWPGKAGQRQRLRAGGRQDATPNRPRRLR